MTRPSRSSCSSNSPISACQSRPVTSRMSCSRLLASSSGAKVRKFVRVRRGDVAQPAAEHPRRLVLRCHPGPHLDAVVTPVGQPQVTQQDRHRWPPGSRSSAGRRRGTASSSSPTGRPSSSNSSSGRYDRSHCSSTRRCSSSVRAAGQRHLMRPEGALHLLAVHDRRTGPALRRPQDDHRPAPAVRQRRPPARPPAGSRRCGRGSRPAPRPSAGAPSAGSSPATTCGS